MEETLSSENDEKRVIISVDDDPINNDIVERILGEQFHIIKTTVGKNVISLIKEHRPFLVLLDVMLPDVSGYELCQMIRYNFPHDLMKILLLSAKDKTEDRLQGYNLGADDYVTKPYVHEELKAKIDVFWKLHQTEKHLKKLNVSLKKEVKKRSKELLKKERLAFLGLHGAQIVGHLKGPLEDLKKDFMKGIERFPYEKSWTKLFKAHEECYEIFDDLLSSSENLYLEIEKNSDLNHIIRKHLNELKLNQEMSDYSLVVKLFDQKNILIPEFFDRIFRHFLVKSLDSMVNSKVKNLEIKTIIKDSFVTLTLRDSGNGLIFPVEKKILKKGKLDLPTKGFIKWIESLKGTISLHSEISKGSTVIIKLPIKKLDGHYQVN